MDPFKAQEVDEDHHNRRLLIIVLLTTLAAAIILGVIFCYYHQGTMTTAFTRMIYKMRIYLSAAEEDLNGNGSDLIVFNYLTIKVATDNFSKENKLGEGGFGVVYKGKLRK